MGTSTIVVIIEHQPLLCFGGTFACGAALHTFASTTRLIPKF